jgi:hypothetical protein
MLKTDVGYDKKIGLGMVKTDQSRLLLKKPHLCEHRAGTYE